MSSKNYSPIKAGLKQGFGLPGVGMGSAMLGFGALAYETGLDIFVGFYLCSSCGVCQQC